MRAAAETHRHFRGQAGTPAFLRLLLLLLLLAVCAGAQPAPLLPTDTLPASLLALPVPKGLPRDIFPPVKDAEAVQKVVGLGRRLFFDPILSANATVSCASCHQPEQGFANPHRFPLGVHGRRAGRNAPTLFNRVLGRSHSWDGRAATLEAQMLLPIEDPNEMDLPLAEALARLAGHPVYSRSFGEVYGGPPSRERLADALASFVRRLVLGGSVVDHFRGGDAGALNAAERGGLWVFESKGRCWRCHSGPNFSDEGFHNTGVGLVDGEPEPGREAVTGRPQDRGRFKTPTLRGLLHTAPYMHDGSLATLEEVVAFYRRGGGANGHLDPLLKPVDLGEGEAARLVSFLEALSRVPGQAGR